MGIKEQILPLFFGRIKTAMEKADLDYDHLREIRLRVNQPVILLETDKMMYLSEDGKRTDLVGKALRSTLRELRETIEAACGYSGYAFEEEIKRGYVTIPGGHRIGLAGQVVMNGNEVQTLKYISALNIRISHPASGCAEPWGKYFYEKNKPCHVLIISPPGCGKTTLLRDAVRLLSDGGAGYPGVTVGVVDERSEIAGTYRGLPTHNLGMRTDVLDGCPKSVGMEMLLRSMSPQILAVDEIGTADVEAIGHALRCGCKVVATLHGETMEDYLEKPGFGTLVEERVFERYIFLKQGQVPGCVTVVYGQNFEKLWEGSQCT